MSEPISFEATDWSAVPFTEHFGKTGKASWRTIRYGSLRIRLIEFSENYRTEEWCKLGHIVYCLDGEMLAELSDGRSFTLRSGMSYQVTDGVSAHRTSSENGARVLIVDGDFLKTKTQFNPWKM